MSTDIEDCPLIIPGQYPATSAEATGSDCRLAVALEAHELLSRWLPQVCIMLGAELAGLMEYVVELAVADLHAMTRRDPSSGGSWRLVLSGYRTIKAVLAYRIAHAIIAAAPEPDPKSSAASLMARQISEQAKVETGVEIHPSAQIGTRLVVDHGMGTVIGETAVLGDDCYLLQGVVIGATGIADNPLGKRHPSLGDRVEVGAFARVLGSLTVGDDAVIGCHTLVTDSVPAGARVNVLHQYQVVVGRTQVQINGIEALDEDVFRVHGRGLDHVGLRVESLVSASDEGIAATVLDRGAGHLLIRAPRLADIRLRRIRLTGPDGASTTLLLPKLFMTYSAEAPGVTAAPHEVHGS